jgi:hypothetical protein
VALQNRTKFSENPISNKQYPAAATAAGVAVEPADQLRGGASMPGVRTGAGPLQVQFRLGELVCRRLIGCFRLHRVAGKNLLLLDVGCGEAALQPAWCA